MSEVPKFQEVWNLENLILESRGANEQEKTRQDETRQGKTNILKHRNILDPEQLFPTKLKLNFHHPQTSTLNWLNIVDNFLILSESEEQGD